MLVTTVRAIAACLIVSLAPLTAHAQIESREAIALRNQILELRHELDEMRAAQAAGGSGGGSGAPPAYATPSDTTPAPAAGDLSAQLLERVTTLEDEVRTLRGRIDEIDNARQRAEADLGKQIGDLQFKLSGGSPTGGAGSGAPSNGGSATGGPSALAQPGIPQAAAVPPRTPERALQEGYLALSRRDYPAAEADARGVLAAGHGPRTTDAQFLLGQALSGQRRYQDAAIAYDDTYNRNPRGSRAPESLIGLANSLTALGDKLAACQTLAKLQTEFPSPRVDLRQPIAAARGRAGCR